MVSAIYRAASRMSSVAARNTFRKEIMRPRGARFAIGLLLILGRAVPADAEVIQLTPIETKIEADVVRERSVWELKELESAKLFIINFVSKWDVDRKYRSTSAVYKKWRKPDALKSAFNKGSYTRIEFLRMDLISDGGSQSPNTKELTVKANPHWFLEGYEGTQTFYFILTKERGDWVVDRLIH
jgi:hypothetical protein